jgi:oxalate decarboxylase/phosphoglucose isomerase-like protein (cupin superfamily)
MENAIIASFTDVVGLTKRTCVVIPDFSHHEAKAIVEITSGSGATSGLRHVLVPAGTNHNIINTGSLPLKLDTLYAPPNHRDGVVHPTRDAAEADNDHFDGKTTE